MQFSKAELPIEITEGGILIIFKDEHSLNEPSPIIFTEGGIVNSTNEEHVSKRLSSIFVINTDEGNVILVIFIAPLKAYWPIDVTNGGIINSFLFDTCFVACKLKAFFSMVFTNGGITIRANE